MQGELKEFLQSEGINSVSNTDRLIALVWWYHRNERTPVLFSQLVSDNQDAGYPVLNTTREKQKLKRDKRLTTTGGGNSFNIRPSAVKQLNEQYETLVENRPQPKSNTLFDLRDFENTRWYLLEVVRQANLSYDYQLFDCCAVMIRRLMEALIIELYFKEERDDEIRDNDGNFMMFQELLKQINKNGKSMGLGRDTPRHLKEVKDLANKSAHAINFNVSKSLIDSKKHDFQMAIAELRQLVFIN